MKGNKNLDHFYKIKRESKQEKKRKPHRGIKRKKDSSDNESSTNQNNEPLKIKFTEKLLDIKQPKAFSKNMQSIRRNSQKQITLDMKNVQMIDALGMLWLYSEIYQAINKNNIRVTCIPPKEFKCRKVLQHIKFFNLIGHESNIPLQDITETDIKSWEIEKGDLYDGEIVAKFIDKFIPPQNTQSKDVYSIVKEVIVNSIEHAYDRDRDQQIFTWMMFGRLSDDGSKLTICIGDLGKTIPETVRKVFHRERGEDWNLDLRRLSRRFNYDNKVIKYALTNSKRYTGKFQIFRGYGLLQVYKKVMALNGNITVYSRKGLYFSNSKSLALKEKIAGTIMNIEIPLNADKEANLKWTKVNK